MSRENLNYDSLMAKLDTIAVKGIHTREAVHSCISAVVDAVGAARGVLLLWNSRSRDWKVFFQCGHSGANVFDEGGVNRSLVNFVAREKKPLLSVSGIRDLRFFYKKMIRTTQNRSVLCAPLMSGSNLIGVIYLDIPVEEDLFTEKDRDYLVKGARRLSEIMLKGKPGDLTQVP